jgi:hypothetical protein
MIRSAAFALLAALAVVPVQAKDLLDHVIAAVDPTLAPARPLIECLAGGGEPERCALDAAKAQAMGALPIGPGDDRVQKAVAVFAAARDGHWPKVVQIGGEVVAKSVACAVLPLQGPVKGAACAIVGHVIAKKAGLLGDVLAALKGPDWWRLFELLGSESCALIPDEGAAGVAREMLCGTLAQVLAEVQQWAKTLGGGLVAGSDALENLVFGDDSHMSYDRYFALYWQPWYHYGTARAYRGKEWHTAPGRVYDRCVDYFDAHNQYRSTARKTCGNLRDKFDRHVQGFAAALPVAVQGYFSTVAKPAARIAAISTWGKPASGGPPPGENLFVMVCETDLRQRVPFPEVSEVPCLLLEERAKQIGKGMFGPLYGAMAKMCFHDAAARDVQPTVWADACEELRPMYGQAVAGEALWLIATVGKLKGRGCTIDDAVDGKPALRIHCADPAAHSACRSAFHPNADKYCRLSEPPLRAERSLQQADAVFEGPMAASGPAAAMAAAADERAQPVEMRRVTEARAGNGTLQLRHLGVALAPIRIEAETLLERGAVRVAGGSAFAQPMSGFGPHWSGDAQLFWRDPEPGATLDLSIEVPRDGAWRVAIALTRAPDYGVLAFEVDQHPVRARFDGYAAGVGAPLVIELGTFAMQRGTRPVSLMVSGRNPLASAHFVGIDHILLTPAGD